ncbi:MAG: hybrid sensor histidine kinase/response regulator [Elainellaceae cyanobacterium]
MTKSTILIVENEVLIARKIETTPMLLGYEVAGIVLTDKEAIAKVDKLQPSLVLMDIVLLGAIADIAASKVQSQFQTSAIYIPAYDNSSVMQKVQESQPVGYQDKLFDDHSLSAAIETGFGQQQAKSEIPDGRRSRETPTSYSSLEPAVQNYLSMAAHEIGNFLDVIQCSTELLNDVETSFSTRQKAIQHIQKATLQIDWLKEDLIILSQTGENQYSIKETTVDLIDVSNELLSQIKITQFNLERLTFLSNRASLPVCLDERLFNYMLRNLLLNALKYSPEDTPVWLQLDQVGNKIEISIQDQGIGIPKEDYLKLFQPFQRGSNVGNAPGTGLGLSIVKRCVNLLQAEVSFDSEVGKGTTFKITLPATNKPELG